MKLTTQQAYVLLQKHGCYITEICELLRQQYWPSPLHAQG